MNRSDDLFPQPGGTPDPFWQRAFEDASDMPPPRVWEGVERQLDLDESDGILPLWQHREGRQSMLFGRWVAGIAASLLLTALGWWAWHREDAIRPDVSVAVAPRSTDRGTAPTPGTLAPTGPSVASADRTNVRALPLPRVVDNLTAARSRQQADRVASNSREGLFARGTYLSTGTSAVADRRPLTKVTEAQQLDKQAFNPGLDRAGESNGTLVFTETTRSVTVTMKEAQPFQPGLAGSQPATMPRSAVTGSVTMQSFSKQSITGYSQFGQRPTTSFQPAPLTGVPTQGNSMSSTTGDSPERMAMAGAPLDARPSTIGQQVADRTAVAANEETSAEPAATASKKRRQRPWLSAGVVASAYNPTVGIRSAFSPVGTSSLQSMVAGSTSAGVPTIQSQAGRAVAFQAGLGIPLGEHWSIETGVGYLSGQNEVQSPARVATLTSAVKSATADNLYLELISRLTDRAALANNYSLGASNAQYDAIRGNQASNYASNQQQVVSNLYQFVQVPVQVGYELRPRRKFGLALLTGMVSNWFVRNTVAESVTIKASDGVYRPVTLAGTAGMRLRYRTDNHWSASVAGTFQQSLQSLTRTDVNLQAQPQQVGLSFSVDRHF